MRIVDKGNDIIIDGHLYSLVCDTIGTAEIKVYEDNTYLTSVTTDEAGFFHIVIPTSTTGVRNFKLIYDGDVNYSGSESTTIEVTVRDAPVLEEIILESDKTVCQLGERFHFTATCESQYDDNLENIQVQLKKDDVVIETETTNNDGKAYFKFTPDTTGTFNITANNGNITSTPILVVVTQGNIYEIIADLNEFPGTYSKEEIDALLLSLKLLLEEEKADVDHIHNIRDIPHLQEALDDRVTWEAYKEVSGDKPCRFQVLGDQLVFDFCDEGSSCEPADDNIASSKVIESSALSNIGTSSGATQHDINLAIDTKISQGGGGGGDSYTKAEIDTMLTSYVTWTGYEDDLQAQDNTSIFLRELDNLIQAITGRGDF